MDAAAAAERTDRLTLLHQQLTMAVDDLAHSDAWRRMLDVAARLPTYSPSNVLLIAVQRPEATRVAGFRAWKSLGRHVVKGEKGIAILAPCLYRGQDTAEKQVRQMPSGEASVTGQETAQRELRGFRVVHVFDVAQTDGERLPDVAPDLLASDPLRPTCGNASRVSSRRMVSWWNVATAVERMDTRDSTIVSFGCATMSSQPKRSRPWRTSSVTSEPTTRPASPTPTTGR